MQYGLIIPKSYDSVPSYSSSIYSIYATYNESTGLYEFSKTFEDDDVYGVYSIDRVSVTDENNNSVSFDEIDIMFKFAEERTDTFNRLKSATNLKWSGDAHCKFKLPQEMKGTFELSIINVNSGQRYTVNYVKLLGDTSWTETVGCDYFYLIDPEPGKYYFTVKIIGDEESVFDGPLAKSGIFEYKLPSAIIDNCESFLWKDEAETYPVAYFKWPADKKYLQSAQVEWYFRGEGGETSKTCGSRYTVSYDEKSQCGYIELPDVILQNYGKGYYSYKVRFISNNIIQCSTGNWSELSQECYVGSVAENVKSKLENIDLSKTPNEVKQDVQSISTEELKEAMLSDESTVNKLREIESMIGTYVDVAVEDGISIFNSSNISTVGAGLNEQETEGNITLSIGHAKEEDIIPSMFDSTIAVKFSMELNNVKNTDNLKVPVLLDIPVPDNINPSQLVILHYHNSTNSPEVVYPFVYQVGNQWYAQFVVTSFSDFAMTEYVGKVKAELDEYLIMKVDETLKVNVYNAPDTDVIAQWRVTDVDGNPFISGDEIISVDDLGNVTALKEGTAYVCAELSIDGGETEITRCRIDVLPKEDAVSLVTDVSLIESKADIELFSTNYTKVPILLEMQQLLNVQSILPDIEIERPLNSGSIIKSAKFADSTVDAMFELKVSDDRTLDIVPRYSSLESASLVKSSYKSAIIVNVDGKEFTTDVLTLSIKKTVPRLKASSLKFNTVLPEAIQSITFTGGTVTAIEPDIEAAAKAKKPAIPEFIDGCETNRMTLAEGAKGSGKLYLLAVLEGWSVKVPITVNYSISTSYMKMTFKPGTVTLKPGTYDSVKVNATVSPNAFAECVTELGRITEGSGKSMKTYANGEALNVSVNGNVITVKPVLNDGKAHTYKVYMSMCGKEFGFTVKTLAENAKPTLLVKQTGAIDTGIKNSPVTLACTLKNFNADSGESYNIRIMQYKAKTKTSPEVNNDVTDSFTVQLSGNKINLTEKNKGSLEKGYTYYAYVSAEISGEEKTNEVMTKLNVKWTDTAKVKPTVSLKAAGTIDVIRPETEIKLTPTIKNCYTYSLKSEELVFTKTVGKTITVLDGTALPFEISVRDGSFIIKIKNGATINHKMEKYSVELKTELDGKQVTSKTVKLNVKQGNAKVTADVKQVQMLIKDRYSQGQFKLNVADKTISEISNVKLDAAGEKMFRLVNLGQNGYAIAYKDDVIPNVKSGTTKTVKLSVFFNGNETATANATVSLNVKLK